MRNRVYIKWILFIVVGICTLLSPFFIQHRSTSLLQGGGEYQWPVSLSRTAGWIPSDYLEVRFLGSRGPWQGGRLPVYDQEVYVWVTAKPNGILEVTGVSDKKPTTGDYIFERVTRVDNTDVEFKLLFNRVTLDLNKVNPDFYTTYKGTLLATLKIKDGHGIVTGVYSRGIPLELATPESEAQQEIDSRTPINQIGEPQATAEATAAIDGAGQN